MRATSGRRDDTSDGDCDIKLSWLPSLIARCLRSLTDFGLRIHAIVRHARLIEASAGCPNLWALRDCMNRNGKSLIPTFIDLAAQRERLGDRIERAIASVLQHGQFVLGREVAELERQLADFCGAKHVVSCANGSDALLLVLMAEGIGRGDAVFVPDFTFVATAEVVVLAGATPVFVDIYPDSFNMDVANLEAAISEAKRLGLKPRAVIPVDLYGQPADYSAINKIAETHDLLVLADAAQSFGGSLNGRKVGTLAAYTATSFYPSKPLGGYGDGGAIFTDNDDKAKLLLSLRCHGKAPDKPESELIGLNSRL